MSVESAADRAAMLADWGEAVSWTVGAVTSSITAIYDNGTVRNDMEFAPGALNARGTLTLREQDLPVGGIKGDAITVRGAALKVKSIERDGMGMVLVRVGDAI